MVWSSGCNSTNVNGIIFYKAKSEDDKGTFVKGDNTPSANYSDSDTHIFLPAAGFCDNVKNYGFNYDGRYWSSQLDLTSYSYELEFSHTSFMEFSFNRELAFSVRAVRAK